MKQIVKDAFKVQELMMQFKETDVADNLHDGTIEGVSLFYSDKALIKEALHNLSIASISIEMFKDFPDELKQYKKDEKQLSNFIKKWREHNDKH